VSRIIKSVIAAWRWSRPRPSSSGSTADDDRDRYPGLEVAADKVTAERQIRLATYDALGVKAGILATATVALTALTASGYRPLVIPGLVCAGIALVLSGVVLWPRKVNQLDVEEIRKYMTWQRHDAVLKIMDTEEETVVYVVGINRYLGRVLAGSFVFLGVSAILLIGAAAVGSSEESPVPKKPTNPPTTTPAPRIRVAQPTPRRTFSSPGSSSASQSTSGVTDTPPAAPPRDPDVAMIQVERRGQTFELIDKPARIARPSPRIQRKTASTED
jgi:hypothetical protein